MKNEHKHKTTQNTCQGEIANLDLNKQKMKFTLEEKMFVGKYFKSKVKKGNMNIFFLK